MVATHFDGYDFEIMFFFTLGYFKINRFFFTSFIKIYSNKFGKSYVESFEL